MRRSDSHTSAVEDEKDESDEEVEGLLGTPKAFPPRILAEPSAKSPVSPVRRRSSSWKGKMRQKMGSMGMGKMPKQQRRVFIKEMLTQVHTSSFFPQSNPRRLIQFLTDSADLASLACWCHIYGSSAFDITSERESILRSACDRSDISKSHADMARLCASRGTFHIGSNIAESQREFRNESGCTILNFS